MDLEIRLLGELTVLRDGRPVALPASKKTRALLAYLAATGRPQLREKLCALLWDGPDDPRAALRWSLTKLRPVVDGRASPAGSTAEGRCGSIDDPGMPRLIADRERVELVPAGARIDLVAIRAAVPGGAAAAARASTDALRAVAGRLRGELLEGLELPDCYRWDEWYRAEREAVRRLGSAILATLVERTRGTPEEALGHARARLALEPLDEAAHGTVIQLFAELGRRPEAHAQYASCARLFQRELGHGPSRELERIRMAIGSAAPIEVVVERVVVAPAVPLIGRVQERAALASFVAAPRGPVLLFLGDPGIGKTRLLEELEAMVVATGAKVLHGRGVEAEVVRPYGVWLDALHGTPTGDPFTAAPSGDRAGLFESVTASLVALAGGGSLVVIVDDLQWVDEASAALLHFIARAPAAAPRIRIACGARPGELADNAAALRLVRGLAREGSIHQIGLSPLDVADTAALAAAHAPGVDVARVAAESGGHPLFAVEIARALARGETASASLETLIGERLELLDGAARDLVPWAAALAHGFTADLLATITELPLLELARAIGELERRAIVRTIGDEWDFVHDLVRAAAYHRVSEPRRRLLHLQIARCLAELPDRGGELAGEVSHHAALGGDSLLCARTSLTASERCLRLFAPDEAAAIADRGLVHAAKLTGLPRAQLQIGLLKVAVGADTRRLRRPALAAELERAIVDAQATGAHADAAHGLNVLSRINFDSGAWSSAHTNLVEAVARSRGADQVNQARAIAHAAQCLVLLDREIPKAEALAGEAAELVSGSGAEIAELSFALALVRHHQGDDDAALALLHRTIEIDERTNDHWHRGICFSRAAMIELSRGRLAAALEHGESLRAIAARMGESGDVAFGEVIVAVAQFGLSGGDPAAIESALVALRALDAPVLLVIALTCAAEVELLRDHLEAAKRHADEAVDAAARGDRESEIALARAVSARIAVIEGREPQLAELRAIPAELLSARARAARSDALGS